jgi:glycosyltransferase involved in cell wall biosynthesis
MYLASVESAARVITVSNASRIDLLSHFPALQGKLVLLSPFVSSELTDSDAESKLGTGYFLHVGRWEPRKRQNIIVEAFARARVENPELRLVLVGAKCEYYSIYGSNLESLIQQPVADGWLQLRPNITNSELGSLYRGALATILAPLYEGFGLPALEAMSLGCPLVSSGTGALAEVCGSADFRIMGDLESLIAAIQRLSANDSLRRHLSRLGRLRAAVFTQEKFGRGLVAVIKEIASS